MKLATVSHAGKEQVVSVDPDGTRVRPLSRNGRPVEALLDLLTDKGGLAGVEPAGAPIAVADVTFLAPFPRPRRNIICVGKNYHEHAKEFTRSGFDSSAASVADAIPTAPIVFTKMPESVVGPGVAIRYPHGASEQLDYEAELGVVIGREGRDIDRDRALDHVFGYVVINDVTARDRQARHKQWFLGKSLDTFCPMGPWIATRDEIDLAVTNVRCWVNGELRQDACTRDLIFDVPTLIATISQGLTLLPGDIIATGTPAGVGIGFTPPRFLQPGDEVAIEIDGLGRLVNRVD